MASPLLLALVGMVAGFINAMAAGGSTLTMPALILLGLPANVANGTNRVALLIQNVSATGTFRSLRKVAWRRSFKLALITLPGAAAGAAAATAIDSRTLEKLLAAVMLAVVTLTVLRNGGSGTKAPKQGLGPSRRKALAVVGLLAAGFYGGFIQVGVGFILMGVLGSILGYDLVEVNTHKVFIILLYNVPALAVFAMHHQVAWWPGVVMGLGNAMGAAIGAAVQVKRGEKVVRVVFAAAVLLMAAKLIAG